ncbi:MAG: leucyl/phenylalanyl-tRNA--protein transferase [Phycisphaera sp.]|nr:leucyl/phenylalanyl-tRNA--protein transferase [Phycisphaera sp.]
MLGRKRQKPEDLELTPQLLVAAYCQGVFPMARTRHSRGVEWFSPDPRAVLPLDGFRCSTNIRKKLRNGAFNVQHDTAFRDVITACSHPRPGHPDTWINDDIVEAFTQLHHLGLAHSVEAWKDGELVGGLYGIALGGAFFGESMFHRPELGGTDASKVCLAHLVDHLNDRGFTLLDAQINSPHMSQFGTVDIRRKDYLRRLEEALQIDATW